jgi:hypothetical protein
MVAGGNRETNLVAMVAVKANSILESSYFLIIDIRNILLSMQLSLPILFDKSLSQIATIL